MHAGPQIDVLAPAAEQALVCGEGDAVDTALWTARAGPGDCAVPAAPARAVYVQEGDDIADGQRAPVHVDRRAANRRHRADADVARNDRVGHACKTAMPQMHVGAADFAAERA